jgi:nickel transport protein
MKYLFAVTVLGLILPAAVFAHGVDISDVTGREDVCTIKFSYTDGTPMLFAKVKVFPPSSPDAPAQETIADRNGYFSFVNDEPGEWRLTAEDGMGHKGEIVVAAAGGTETAGTEAAGEADGTLNKAGGKTPLFMRLILGLSLILNIFAVYYFVLIKFPKKGNVHAYQ